jgi:hypothetical protein
VIDPNDGKNHDLRRIKVNYAGQMAAMSAALRMLLSGHPLAKPTNVQIIAAGAFPAREAAQFVSLAGTGQNTLLLVFNTDGAEPILRFVMVFDGVTDPDQVYAGTCSVIQKADGTFALLSQNEEVFEITFSKMGRTLNRTRVQPENRASQEEAGLRALREMAASDSAIHESYDTTATG